MSNSALEVSGPCPIIVLTKELSMQKPSKASGAAKLLLNSADGPHQRKSNAKLNQL